VDAKAKRIALSIKQLTAPKQQIAPKQQTAAAGRSAARPEKVAPKTELSMNEKLAALSTKWKVR
jgi:uncharacterized protein